MGGPGSGSLKGAGAEERRALLALRLVPGLGDRTILRLVRGIGSARDVRGLSRTRLEAIVGRSLPAEVDDPALGARAERILAECEALGIEVLPWGAEGYPGRLLALVDPPPVLFRRGRALPASRAVAIVGARRATPVGRRFAERIAAELSRAGVTIVSGLAYGIDAAAHRGGLQGAGSTIAVLGCGPDRAYPAGHRRLFEAILERGSVVGEFPPGEGARAHHFPRRNRIIAALADAVLVVEAARRSGALITVDHALDLGREVLAVPGSVESEASEGTNALLRDGAHPVMGTEDLLSALGWDLPLAPGARVRRSLRAGGPEEGGALAEIAAAMGGTPRALDDLVDTLGLPPARVLAALTRLEVRGEVCRTEEGWRAVP